MSVTFGHFALPLLNEKMPFSIPDVLGFKAKRGIPVTYIFGSLKIKPHLSEKWGCGIQSIFERTCPLPISRLRHLLGEP